MKLFSKLKPANQPLNLLTRVNYRNLLRVCILSSQNVFIFATVPYGRIQEKFNPRSLVERGGQARERGLQLDYSADRRSAGFGKIFRPALRHGTGYVFCSSRTGIFNYRLWNF